ncbi:DedA family protein [Acinetobacter sp. ANC 4558]|nr:DedA family protein [Acinetobacter sp. ANC 4558]
MKWLLIKRKLAFRVILMDWSNLLQNYGYIAVVVGAFFEGETVLLLGAYAVQQEVLKYWILILAGMLGAFIGDQFYYFIGAKFGHKFINDRPKLAEKFKKASILIDKFPILSILFMRFAWGLRTVIPISFGIKKYHLSRYILVNILAAFIWSFMIVTIGLQVTHWLHKLWMYLIHEESHMHLVIGAVILCICLIGIIYGAIFYHKNKIKNQ